MSKKIISILMIFAVLVTFVTSNVDIQASEKTELD